MLWDEKVYRVCVCPLRCMLTVKPALLHSAITYPWQHGVLYGNSRQPQVDSVVDPLDALFTL